MHHIGIWVRDREAMLRFYRDVLGLPVVERLTFPGRAMEAVFLQVGESTLLELVVPTQPLTQPPAGAGQHVSATPHLCFRVDDVVPWVDRLRAHGVEIAGRGFDGESATLRERGFFLTDPDGTWVEFLEEHQARPRSAREPRVEQILKLSPLGVLQAEA
jgi:catechol 2,3-dioxygenase-like lactoylglutathione lyase family enzyme